MKCTLCPHNCQVDRTTALGRCHSPVDTNIYHISKHMWEEPPISGTLGSGTIFFGGCNLSCRFCQNMDISRCANGISVTTEQLADIFLAVGDSGVSNINLVSPMHYSDKIAAALSRVKHLLSVPVVYNTNGYEKVEAIDSLNGLVDIYIPDYKYYSNQLAVNLSVAENYQSIAHDCIVAMRRQQPVDKYNGDLMTNGVIVRHLALPRQGEDSKLVLDDIASIDSTLSVSLMSQYFSPKHDDKYNFLNGKLTARQYNNLIEYASNIGLSNLFIQQLDSSDSSYVPHFDTTTVTNMMKERE